MLDMWHGLKQSVIDDVYCHQSCVINDAQLMSVVNVPVRCAVTVHVHSCHYGI